MTNNEHQDFIAEFETSHSNEYETTLITQARDLEDLLNDTPDDATEIDRLDVSLIERESIEKMDAECPYLHTKVVVSGDVMRATYDEFTEKFGVDLAVHYNKEVRVAAGFSTLEIPDGQGGSRIAVGHLFYEDILDPISQGQSLVEYIPRLYSFAPIGTVDIVADLPDANNIELLSNSIPELLLEVEHIIFDAKDECDALHRLRALKLNQNQSQDVPQESLVALLNFIEERLEMDGTAPYIVSIQGVVQSAVDDGYHYHRQQNDVFAYHTGLRFSSYPYIKDGALHHSEHCELMAEMNVIGESKNDPLHKIIIPVRNIRAMASIRDSIKPSEQ